MGDQAADAHKAHSKQVAVKTAALIIGALGVMNSMFWWLSHLYFDDHGLASADIMVVRGAFAVLTGVLAIATFLASLAPREIGHGLAVLLGLMALSSAVEAFAHGLPYVMVATLLLAGVLFPALAYLSWCGSRVGWSFLIAMACVFGLSSFFGAPKVRAELGTSLWYALIIPGLYFTTVVSLTMRRMDYRRA
jgi:hypothetical protein